MIRLINSRPSISAAPAIETRGPIEPQAGKKHLRWGNNRLSFCCRAHFVHVVAPAHYLISWRKWNHLPCRLKPLTNPGKFISRCPFAGKRGCFLQRTEPAFRAATFWCQGCSSQSLLIWGRLIQPSSDRLVKNLQLLVSFSSHNIWTKISCSLWHVLHFHS